MCACVHARVPVCVCVCVCVCVRACVCGRGNIAYSAKVCPTDRSLDSAVIPPSVGTSTGTYLVTGTPPVFQAEKNAVIEI